MITIQSSPYPPSTPTVEQHIDPYISRHLQQPNSPYIGYSPSGGQLPPSSPPPLEGGKPVISIPRVSAQPLINPP